MAFEGVGKNERCIKTKQKSISTRTESLSSSQLTVTSDRFIPLVQIQCTGRLQFNLRMAMVQS